MSRLLFLFLFISCTAHKEMPLRLTLPFQEYSVKDPIKQEVDEMYSLLTYSLVYHNWQSGSIPRNKRRGYNIGAVLVDKNNLPVFYDLNCINSTDNSTQHGELRAITRYLEKKRCFNLDGYTIYTSLEPCIMCAGMMTMTDIDRVVYGQNDVDFSHGLERLALDSREFGGFAPFKRTTVSDGAPSQFKIKLDAAYQEFLLTDPEKILAKFLASTIAESIFHDANQFFLEYTVKHSENAELLTVLKKFYDDNKQYSNTVK